MYSNEVAPLCWVLPVCRLSKELSWCIHVWENSVAYIENKNTDWLYSLQFFDPGLEKSLVLFFLPLFCHIFLSFSQTVPLCLFSLTLPTCLLPSLSLTPLSHYPLQVYSRWNADQNHWAPLMTGSLLGWTTTVLSLGCKIKTHGAFNHCLLQTGYSTLCCYFSEWLFAHLTLNGWCYTQVHTWTFYYYSIYVVYNCVLYLAVFDFTLHTITISWDT